MDIPASPCVRPYLATRLLEIILRKLTATFSAKTMENH
jgi:hypothetical protein